VKLAWFDLLVHRQEVDGFLGHIQEVTPEIQSRRAVPAVVAG
jgi:hypothetical protein